MINTVQLKNKMSSSAAVDYPLIAPLFLLFQPINLNSFTSRPTRLKQVYIKDRGFFCPHYHTTSTIAPFVLSKSVMIEHPIAQVVLFGETFICKLEQKYHTVRKSGFIKSCVDNQ